MQVNAGGPHAAFFDRDVQHGRRGANRSPSSQQQQAVPLQHQPPPRVQSTAGRSQQQVVQVSAGGQHAAVLDRDVQHGGRQEQQQAAPLPHQPHCRGR